MQNDVCREKMANHSYHRGAGRYCWTTHEAQSPDECGWLLVWKKSGEVERLLQIPIGFMPQPSNGFETGNALKTENIQAIETINQSCAMSQAQLTRAFQCNKTLPYPVNDCMQVRKVRSLLHTTESDKFHRSGASSLFARITTSSTKGAKVNNFRSIFSLFIRPHT